MISSEDIARVGTVPSGGPRMEVRGLLRGTSLDSRRTLQLRFIPLGLQRKSEIETEEGLLQGA